MELANIIVAIVAAILSLVSIIFSAYTYFKALVHDRRQATLEAYNQLQDSVFDPLNQISINEIKEILKDPKSTRYKEISGYVARIENFCVGVNTEIYDKQIVYALAHGYLDYGIMKTRLDLILDTKKELAKKEYYENIRSVIKWMREKNHE